MPKGVSSEVRRLISEHIVSVEQLEVLLMLREQPDRSFSAKEVSEYLRSSDASVEMRLDDLAGRKLIVASVTDPGQRCFRYAPASQPLRHAIDALAQAYDERPYAVIDLIFSKPIDNLRVYADAFRLKRQDDD